jgi:hypothetical protein
MVEFKMSPSEIPVKAFTTQASNSMQAELEREKDRLKLLFGHDEHPGLEFGVSRSPASDLSAEEDRLADPTLKQIAGGGLLLRPTAERTLLAEVCRQSHSNCATSRCGLVSVAENRSRRSPFKCAATSQRTPRAEPGHPG